MFGYVIFFYIFIATFIHKACRTKKARSNIYITTKNVIPFSQESNNDSFDDMNVDVKDTLIMVMTVREVDEDVLYDIHDVFCEKNINEVRNSIFRCSYDKTITWTLEYYGNKTRIIQSALKEYINENCITTPLNIYFDDEKL
jgi:hypothetical protein